MHASVVPRLELARSRWSLAERQAKVLELLATGASNKEIAARLERAEVTIEKHVTALLRHAGVSSRVELIVKLFTLAP